MGELQSLFAGHPFWTTWGVTLAVIGLAVLAGLGVHTLLFYVLKRWSLHQGSHFLSLLYVHWRAPFRLVLPLMAVMLALSSLTLPSGGLEVARHILGLVLILNAAWLLTNTVFLMRAAVLSRFDVTVADNLRARAVHTQVNVLVKILLVMIAVVTLASLLMTFEKVRQVGVSLLASAGILGVVAGFAAQSSLATLIAGIQIAVTQPIRIDDVVIVEGEWGRVEEITLTYVVVQIWDQRRLIVPISYFLGKPFQNWTRVSADLLGTVTLHADYSVPVDTVRAELHRLLQQSPRWDGRTWGLQVTAATERTVELRALMSAPDASTAWDLRCEVREQLISFLQRHHPDALPRVRAEVLRKDGVAPAGEFVSSPLDTLA